jgi:acetylornithine aminotransferase
MLALDNETYLDRYATSLMGVYGRPKKVLTRGQGCYVWDADGVRYLDLLAGIAVNSLGHGHPAVIEALCRQGASLIHVSNFFATPPQIELAERLLAVAGAPTGSAVFFANSGTEAIEAAIKLSRRTGRTGLVAAEAAFHGRTTGALALTHKRAYREPFEPLLPSVTHVPLNDQGALRAAVSLRSAAVFLEPIQGEAGVIAADPAYLQLARELTAASGTLLIIDEVQTGVGRTGTWFAFQQAGIVPDAITVAKGLGAGVPIGALITFGRAVSGLLTAGQHGTTFGGNPLAASVGLAVLSTRLQPCATRLFAVSAAQVCYAPSSWPPMSRQRSPIGRSRRASLSTHRPPMPSGLPPRLSSPRRRSTRLSAPCPLCCGDWSRRRDCADPDGAPSAHSGHPRARERAIPGGAPGNPVA